MITRFLFSGTVVNLKNSQTRCSASVWELVPRTDSTTSVSTMTGVNRADERLQRISANLNLRAYGFTAGLTSQVQWHFERRYQQILTLTYDFSPALSLGSRLIWQVESVQYLLCIAPLRLRWHRFLHYPRRSKCLGIQTTFGGKGNSRLLNFLPISVCCA